MKIIGLSALDIEKLLRSYVLFYSRTQYEYTVTSVHDSFDSKISEDLRDAYHYYSRKINKRIEYMQMISFTRLYPESDYEEKIVEFCYSFDNNSKLENVMYHVFNKRNLSSLEIRKSIQELYCFVNETSGEEDIVPADFNNRHL